MALAEAHCPGGVVLVSDLQSAGRGRLDRSWEAPAGTSAMFSVVLDPTGPDHAWGLLPLLAGVPRPRRAKLVGRALSRIEHWFTAWDAVGTDPAALDRLLDSYRERCLSIGAELRVARPGADELMGTGAGIGPGGELLVDADGTQVAVTAGDVVHASTR